MSECSPDAKALLEFLAGRTLTANTMAELTWERLVALARQQQIAPVLYARLKQLGVEPPSAAASQLREIYVASAALNLRLFHELTKLLNAFQTAAVAAIPIKGASLAVEVYGDVALRPMADVDLWIQRRDLEAARSVMQSLGYTVQSHIDRPQGLQDALTGETQMVKANAPLVELHWNMFPGEWLRHTARVDEHAIWSRSIPTDRGFVRKLSPEDVIIHLCVHLAVNHQMSGSGLRTLVDLDWARRRWDVNWAMVARRALTWRVSYATWLVLRGLADLFGDPDGQLPLRELAPSPMRQWILSRFASSNRMAEGLELRSGPLRFLFLLLVVDRKADALLLVWRAVFPDRLWLTLRYDEPGASGWRVAALHLRHLSSLVSNGEL